MKSSTLPRLVSYYERDDLVEFRKIYSTYQNDIDLTNVRLIRQGKERMIVNACKNGAIKWVEYLCGQEGVSTANQCYNNNYSLAHFAVIGDQPAVLRYILNLDPKLYKSKDGKTPIDDALKKQSFKCLRVLAELHYSEFRNSFNQNPIFPGYHLVFERIKDQARDITTRYTNSTTLAISISSARKINYVLERVFACSMLELPLRSFMAIEWSDEAKEQIIDAIHNPSSEKGKLIENVSEALKKILKESNPTNKPRLQSR